MAVSLRPAILPAMRRASTAPRRAERRRATSRERFVRRSVMSLIKPRTRGKQMVRLITRLDRENNETLYAYAQFLGEPTEYVLNQLIDTVLAKDKDFVAWRAEHPAVVRASPPRAADAERDQRARRERLGAASVTVRRIGHRDSRNRAPVGEGANHAACHRPGARVLAMTIAVAVGSWGLHAFPVRLEDDLFLQMIFVRKPRRLPRAGLRVRDAVVQHAVPRRLPACCRCSRSSRPSAPTDGRDPARFRRTPHPSTGRRRRSCWARRISRPRRAARPRRRG